MRNWQNPELEAEIYYLTPEEGGRQTAVRSDYRGQLYYNGRDWDALQQFIDKEICHPGETVKVHLHTLSPQFHVGQFFEGKTFETREGGRTVGRGKITKVLRPDFNYWDMESFQNQLPGDCKPYDQQQVEGFISEFKRNLLQQDGAKPFRAIKYAYPKAGFLTITCQVKHKDTFTRTLADAVFKSWQTISPFQNARYKMRIAHMQYNGDSEIELSFAILDKRLYLLGKLTTSTPLNVVARIWRFFK